MSATARRPITVDDINQQFDTVRSRRVRRLARIGLSENYYIEPSDRRWKIAEKIERYHKRAGDRIYSQLPPPVRTCEGWQGALPDREIKSIEDLVGHLNVNLRRFRRLCISRLNRQGTIQSGDAFAIVAFEFAQDAYRNAWRVMDEFGMVDQPMREDDSTPIAVEKSLSNLIRAIRPTSSDQDESDDDPPADEGEWIEASVAAKITNQIGSTISKWAAKGHFKSRKGATNRMDVHVPTFMAYMAKRNATNDQ